MLFFLNWVTSDADNLIFRKKYNQLPMNFVGEQGKSGPDVLVFG